MFCAKCGAKIEGNLSACPQCGTPTQSKSYGSVGVLICGILSILLGCVGIILGPIAIFMGIKGRAAAKGDGVQAPSMLTVGFALGIVGTVLSVLTLVAFLILMCFAGSNFSAYRTASQKSACISNLKQIQVAYELSCMNGSRPDSVSDLVGVDKYIKIEPKCPAGGTYSFALSDEEFIPVCSHPGHELPVSSDY